MPDIVHQCPPGGSGLMPCCGKTPFEVGPLARITENPDSVTCTGSPASFEAHPPPFGQHSGKETAEVSKGPIRKSLLPCTPPPEWEFSSVLGAPHGVALIPDSDTGPVVVRRRVTYGDWEPVRPDHWADEEPTDVAAPQAVRANAPAPDDTDLTERREQIAEELARLDCAKFEHPVPDKDHDFWRIWRAKADAVLAVRDTRLQQLQAERDRVREWLPVLRRAVDSLPAVCRYHGERLDPPQGIIRREACCDTGVPARRRREAEQALAALDQADG